MKKLFAKAFCIVTVIWTSQAYSQIYDDQPKPEESFSSFFARITHGGFFNGIRLEAPKSIQDSFLKHIKKSTWVGKRDQVYKSLESQGVNLWGDWFRASNTNEIIFASESSKTQMLVAMRQILKEDIDDCLPSCPTAEEILKSPWVQGTAFSHQVFAKAYVLRAPIFGGKTIAEFLAAHYAIAASDAISTTQIRLLNSEKFKNAVHDLGYGGEIYFRGITSVDPKNPKLHIILLDDEALAKGSPFDYPLYKNLEVPAILTHELSHVMQDLKGNSLGLDIQVTSAETAMVIEGMAEYTAEKSLREAGDLTTYPSALSLFSTEQAVEIVYRPGNESSGNLFPYTVGLPFIASLYDLAADKNLLRDRLLGILGDKEKLQDFLKSDFFKMPSH